MLGKNIWRHGVFMLHQATECAYHCLLLTVTLYSPKSHRIKVLRSRAEEVDNRLIAAWPRDNRFSRRCFELLSRAYVEARYSSQYSISQEELAWLTEHVKKLHEVVQLVCLERLSGDWYSPSGAFFSDSVVRQRLPPAVARLICRSSRQSSRQYF